MRRRWPAPGPGAVMSRRARGCAARWDEASRRRQLSVALERLHQATRQIAVFFETYDLLLTPALACPPVRHGDLQPRGLEAALQGLAARLGVGRYLRYGSLLRQAADRAFRFMPFSPIWNVTGQPAASLPLHWTRDGLPVGVQVVARFGGRNKSCSQ